MTIRSSIADLAARAVRAAARGRIAVGPAIVDRHDGDNDFDWRTNGEMSLLGAVVPAGRVVFDVGANVGDWTTPGRLKDIWEAVAGANPEYEMYKILPDGVRRMPSYRQTLETFQYSSWVVAHPRCAALLPIVR